MEPNFTQPEMRGIESEEGHTLYLNSGDWVENLTALEYDNGAWSIYRYSEDTVAHGMKLPRRLKNNLDNDLIFRDLVNQFLVLKK